MSSTAQIVANRTHAALSTGPRTPHGKAAARRNAGTQWICRGERVHLAPIVKTSRNSINS